MDERDHQAVSYVYPKLVCYLLAWIAFLLPLLYDPEGDSRLADRMLVRLVNFLGASFYETAAQNDIVVVVVDATSLAELKLGWPLPYVKQADVIGKIMRHRPRMLGIDLLFLDQYREDEVDMLWDTIDELRRQAPIFAAAAPKDLPAAKVITNADGAPLPFAQADITQHSDWPDMGYRLLGRADGSASPEDSLAFAMYRELCRPALVKPPPSPPANEAEKSFCKDPDGFDPLDYRREMLVFWGRAKVDYHALFGGKFDIADEIFTCKGSETSFLQAVTGAFFPQEEDPRSTCAFHPVIPLDVLDRLGDEELDAALGGKIVFYAIDHPGIPDIIDPPTTQPIAGVHLHAMALDNLITFGSGYFGTTTRTLPAIGSVSLFHTRLFFDLAVFVVILFILLRYNPTDTRRRVEKEIRCRSDLVAALLHPWRETARDCRLAWQYLPGEQSHPANAESCAQGKRRIKTSWKLQLAMLLLLRTLPGRVFLFACLLVGTFLLDYYVLKLPPINAVNVFTLFTASQLMVPVTVFSHHNLAAEAKRQRVVADE